MVGQWFPKLARREPDGRWAHFAFHPHAEFYADFGDYDVTLEVPAGFVVGATGQRIEQRVTGERRTERYRAEAVHDFAWAAWDGFEVEERTVGATKITLLAPPHTAPARAATWESLEHALPYLGALYGPYPHPTLTVVTCSMSRGRGRRHGIPHPHHHGRLLPVASARRATHRAGDGPRARPPMVSGDVGLQRGRVALPRRRAHELRRVASAARSLRSGLPDRSLGVAGVPGSRGA